MLQPGMRLSPKTVTVLLQVRAGAALVRFLLFPKDEVHRPAASGMRPFATAVLDQVFVLATGVEQGVGEDGKAAAVQSAGR